MSKQEPYALNPKQGDHVRRVIGMLNQGHAELMSFLMGVRSEKGVPEDWVFNQQKMVFEQPPEKPKDKVVKGECKCP